MHLINLTPNLTLAEFACPCCSQVSADYRLVSGLQELREKIQKTIIIASAFRCAKHNQEIGGDACSNHLIGTAADIIVPGWSLSDLLEAAERIQWFNGLGLSERYVHVDVRSRREYFYYNRGVAIPCTRDRLMHIAIETL